MAAERLDERVGALRAAEGGRLMAGAHAVADAFLGWAEPAVDAGRAAADAARDWLDDLFPERHGEWTLRPMSGRKAVADSPGRLVAVDRLGLAQAIVFVSSPASPGLVGRGAEYAAEERRLLGRELGAGVLKPLRTGVFGGLTVAAFPWRLEVGHGWLRSRVRRPRVRRWLFGWLRGVTKASAARYPTPLEADAADRLLGRMTECRALGEDVRRWLGVSRARLARGEWKPRAVVDHHDLWAGNVLVNRDALARPMGPSPYVVIDWAGANLRGGGFADVVRAARAFGASDRMLREELIVHCGLLGLWPRDAMSQAMLSLAGLYERLECFPERTFAEVADRTAGAVARVFGPDAREA